MAHKRMQVLRDECEPLGVSAQFKLDNPILAGGCRDQFDSDETAPVVRASPSRRTSDKLDEEE
jgi:hypothetical protein